MIQLLNNLLQNKQDHDYHLLYKKNQLIYLSNNLILMNYHDN